MADLIKLKITPDSVRTSQKWFSSQISAMKSAGVTRNSLFKSEGMEVKASMVPGAMYFYWYDPKFSETLPYYDTFPLVLPYAKTKGGFIGLNFHYLEYRPRIALLTELMRVSGAKGITDTDKIRYSWAAVKQMSTLPWAQNCVKQYLSKQLGSPFVKVNPTMWITAAMLPVHGFAKKSDRYVWNQTYRT